MNAMVRDRETDEVDAEHQPSWWPRRMKGDHPTLTALTGFFTGLFFVALVPAAFVGLLHLVVDDETTDDLFPLVLLAFVVPLALVASSRTRRFGRYMLIGMVVTALVVLGVAALVVWLMVQRDQ